MPIEIFLIVKIHSTVSKIMNKLLARSMTMNLKDIETNKMSIIVCCNDGNIKQLLYFLERINIPNRLRKSLKNMPS